MYVRDRKRTDSFCTQSGFEFIIFLPQPLEWDADVCHHNQLSHTVCVFVLSFWGQGVHVCACCRVQRLILCVFLYLYLFKGVCVLWRCPWRSEKSIRSHGAGGLQTFVNPTWVLGMELPPSTRAGSALITWAISLASFLYLTLWGRISHWV